jgi:multicomponent Na+:H+ antiporter subunit B
MGEYIILRVLVRLLVPFIIMFGLYVQLHGEYSPGGGFQAGVICAAALIFYGLVFDLGAMQKIVPFTLTKILAACGALIYGGVGVVAMLKGGEFLNYSVLAADPVVGQQIGILVIELGVGLTVFAVMMLIFYVFAERGA